MRVLPSLVVAVVSAACIRSSGVFILDARVQPRQSDRLVAVDVQLEAVEQGGGKVGRYCVSFHVFPIGFNPFTEEQTSYFGELEKVEECDDELSDGDQRTYRLRSMRTDLAPNLPIRVQTTQNGVFRTKENLFTPPGYKR